MNIIYNQDEILQRFENYLESKLKRQQSFGIVESQPQAHQSFHPQSNELKSTVHQLSQVLTPRLLSTSHALSQLEEIQRSQHQDAQALDQLFSTLHGLQQSLSTLTIQRLSSSSSSSTSNPTPSSPSHPHPHSVLVHFDPDEPRITIRPRTREEWALYYSQREATLGKPAQLARLQAAQVIQRTYRSTRLRLRWLQLIAKMSALSKQRSIMASWADKGKQQRAAVLIQRAWRGRVLRQKWAELIAKARNLDPSHFVSSLPRPAASSAPVHHSRGDHLVLDPASPGFVYPFLDAAASQPPPSLSESSSQDDLSADDSSAGGGACRGGTLVQLVQLLLTPGVEESFARQFLLTLPMTCPPDRFFRLLALRYAVPAKTSLDPSAIPEYFHGVIAPIQSHTLSVLHRWLLHHYDQIYIASVGKQQHHPHDGPGAGKRLDEEIKGFLEEIHAKGFYRAQVEECIRLLAHRQFLFSDAAYIRGLMTADEYYEFIATEPRALVVPAGSHAADDAHLFEKTDPQQIARQWTYIDNALLLDINLGREMFGRGWLGKKKHSVSPHVVAVQERLNQMTYWTASKILLESNLKARAKLLGHFIQVADELRLLGNFQGLSQIYMGLILNPVDRLKQTWAALPAKLQQAWEGISDLMSPLGSYKTYRRAYARQPCPKIPNMVVVLNDLYNIEDANPDDFELPEAAPPELTQINFYKRAMIAGVLELLKEAQLHMYCISPSPPMQELLLSGGYLDQEERSARSLQLEPRGGARAKGPDSSLSNSLSRLWSTPKTRPRVGSMTERQASSPVLVPMKTELSNSSLFNSPSASSLSQGSPQRASLEQSGSSPRLLSLAGRTSHQSPKKGPRAATMNLPAGTWAALAAQEEEASRGRSSDSICAPKKRSKSPRRFFK